jgi:hypothetical protein
MRPSAPDPVKLFVGILYSDEELLEQAAQRLEEVHGPVDFRSAPVPFEVTDYYQEEMGGPISRLFVSFGELIDPGRLAEIKIGANKIENRLAVDGRRRVNLDPGYMDVCKVVLASAKYNGQKIYLADGIYADPTLHYEKGHFQPYPWSFPDFQTGQYEKIFLRIRELYKAKKKRSGGAYL